MRKNVPNEPNMEAILNLLTSLDGGLLKAIQENGISIIGHWRNMTNPHMSSPWRNCLKMTASIKICLPSC